MSLNVIFYFLPVIIIFLVSCILLFYFKHKTPSTHCRPIFSFFFFYFFFLVFFLSIISSFFYRLSFLFSFSSSISFSLFSFFPFSCVFPLSFSLFLLSFACLKSVGKNLCFVLKKLSCFWRLMIFTGGTHTSDPSFV